jgi:zinc transporter 1/2/3
MPNLSHHFSDSNTNTNVTEQVHTHHNHLEQHLQGSFVAGIMLFVTLDIHSIFAGMSVGIQLNDMPLLVALTIHKFTAAFALGSTFCTINVPRKQFMVLALIFSLTTPLGVFFGVVFSNEVSSTVVYGVLHAVVGGTFLYIGILELGMKELLVCRTDPHGSGVKIDLEKIKLFALVLGYAVMALLAVWL